MESVGGCLQLLLSTAGSPRTETRRRVGRTSRLSSLSSPQDAFLLVAAVLLLVLCLYAFFYLNLSTEINLDLDAD